MALKSPERGEEIQLVQVNGMYYRQKAYGRHAPAMVYGEPVELWRDSKNSHDPRAVQVRFKGEQIGWVPKTANADIAKRLDRGEKLTAMVKYHDRSTLQLQIGVYAEVSKTNCHTFEVTEFGKSSQDPEAYNRFVRLPQGTVLRCVSGNHRTSISIVDEHGHDLAWFRKAGVPTNLIILADKGSLRCQFMEPKSVTLFWQGAAPPFSEPPDTVVIAGGRQAGRSAKFAEMYGVNNTKMVMDSFWERGLGKSWVDAINQQADEINEATGVPDHMTGVRDEYDDALRYMIAASATKSTTTKKETTMNFSNITTNFINTNKGAFAQAGYLEAGRIANNQLIKLSKPMLPMLARGYAETPVGKLVIANLAQMAAAQLRPQDPTLAKLTTAMTVAAYQEVIQTVDIEGWLDQLLGSPEIKRAMSKLNDEPKVFTTKD